MQYNNTVVWQRGLLCLGILTKEGAGIYMLHWFLLFNCCYTMGEYAYNEESPFSSVPWCQQVTEVIVLGFDVLATES